MAIVFFIAFVLSICALGWIGGIILAVISVGIADMICTTESIMQLTSSIIMIGVLVALYIAGDKMEKEEQKKISLMTPEERKAYEKNKVNIEIEAINNKIQKLKNKYNKLENKLMYLRSYDASYDTLKAKEKADKAYNKQLIKYHEYHGYDFGKERAHKRYHKANAKYHRKEAEYLRTYMSEGSRERARYDEINSIKYRLSDIEDKIIELEIKRDELLAKI